MGDRVSVSFKKDGIESVAIFSHWGGTSFAFSALEYARNLKQKVDGKQVTPIQRLEPSTVIVDFIRDITKGIEIVESDLYLGKDSTQGDNSDNGHFIVDLNKLELHGGDETITLEQIDKIQEEENG